MFSNNVQCILLTTLLVCVFQFAGADNDLEVYSTLHVPERMPAKHDGLLFYPTGVKMNLTCQRKGRRNVYWFENVNGGTRTLLTNGTEEISGVRSTVIYFDPLNKTDNGRQLLCAFDGSDEARMINFSVQGETNITTKAVDGVLTCTAPRLSHLMKLCWFDDNGQQLEKCTNGNKISGTSVQLIWSDKSFEDELENKGKDFICRSQFIDDTKLKKLKASAMKRFEELISINSKIINLRKEVRDLADCHFPDSESPPSPTFVPLIDDKCIIVTVIDVPPPEKKNTAPSTTIGQADVTTAVPPLPVTTKSPMPRSILTSATESTNTADCHQATVMTLVYAVTVTAMLQYTN